MMLSSALSSWGGGGSDLFQTSKTRSGGPGVAEYLYLVTACVLRRGFFCRRPSAVWFDVFVVTMTCCSSWREIRSHHEEMFLWNSRNHLGIVRRIYYFMMWKRFNSGGLLLFSQQQHRKFASNRIKLKQTQINFTNKKKKRRASCVLSCATLMCKYIV